MNSVVSICLQKYARIFVLGHYLFLEAHSFPRASLSENCSLLGTDNLRGQISVNIFAPNGDYCLYNHHARSLLSLRRGKVLPVESPLTATSFYFAPTLRRCILFTLFEIFLQHQPFSQGGLSREARLHTFVHENKKTQQSIEK